MAMIRTYASGEKLSYRYQRTGDFRLQTSDNISSLNIVGSDQSNTIQKQLRTVKSVNLSVSVIRSNCFRSCERLEYANFETSRIQSMESGCFSNCPSLKNIRLGLYLSSLSQNLVSSCSLLSSVTFPFFETDSTTSELSSGSTSPGGAYLLQNVDGQVVTDCPSLTSIAVPPSISQSDQISKNALNGSDVKYVSLLGISSDSSLSDTVKQSQCFGLGKACSVETADDKLLKYSNGQVEITDTEYDAGTVVKTGKPEKLRLGKAYWFEQPLVEWCLSENVPFVTVLFDSKTSQISKTFISQVLFDSNMPKQLKTREFFVLMLDRHGMVPGVEQSSVLSYYRTAYAQTISGMGCQPSRDFVSFDFVYDGKCNSVSLEPNTLESMLQALDEYALKTGFDKWDSSKYKVTVDIPDPETIPSKQIDTSGISKWEIPGWYSSGQIATGTDWTPTSDCMNFKFVSTPDTTYCIICVYDMKYPNDPPTSAATGMLSIFKKHSNHVDCYYEGTSGSAKVFLEGIKKGIGYHYFMFYEFSHGSNYHITLPGGVSRDQVWNALKDAHNRLIGMFDSCDSGSMIQTVSPYAFSGGWNEPLGSFIIRKFKEQRDERVRKRMSMLTAGTASVQAESEVDEEEPAIWMWSSTAKSHYGWYLPKSGTVFASAIKSAYSQCQKKRNSDMWSKTKANGTRHVGEGTDECIPQEAKHGDSFEKNMTFT